MIRGNKCLSTRKVKERKILATLDEISAIAQSLKVWTEKNLR